MPIDQKNWPLIKVCGIQTPDEARISLQHGANTIGLLIGITHKAEDKITSEKGYEIAQVVRQEFPNARITLVTHLLEPQEVINIAESVGVTAIQIHDEMTPENVAILRLKMPNIELFKAIHIQQNGVLTTQDAAQKIIEKASRYSRFIDAFITDSKSIEKNGEMRIGGTGKRHDPTIGRALVEAFPNIPVILAGGLNDSNIEEAIQAINPAGIDANSGLENPDGSKNIEKIQIFAEAGRRYLNLHGALKTRLDVGSPRNTERQNIRFFQQPPVNKQRVPESPSCRHT